MEDIPGKGTDRPSLRYFNRYVKDSIGKKWYDVGVELLDDGLVLDQIKTSNFNDISRCTTDMFNLWLQRKPDATWNQLIEALRVPNIQLKWLASKIEQMLSKGEPQSHYHKVFNKNFSKLKSILDENLTNLLDHFVMERIIAVKNKETVNVDSLLHTIELHLISGINSTFDKMVEIMMKEYGSLAVTELGEHIKAQLDELSVDEVGVIDFTIFKHVDDMFSALVSGFHTMLNKDKFEMLQKRLTLNRKVKKLPSEFTDKICATTKLSDLIDVVAYSPYCNWMNVRLLQQMAAASLQQNVYKLVDHYKNAVSSKKLVDVFQQITETEVPQEYYSKIEQRWEKNFKEVTLKDVMREWERLEKIFDFEEPTLLLESVLNNCIQFFWLIPAELVCHARYSAFMNWHQLDDILYLDICAYVIKDCRYDFTSKNLNTATPYEVIDHFTDFLLVSLKHEMLLPSMQSYGLLAKHDFEVIGTAPTGYHRNRLILSCVRHMDITGLFIFGKILQETHPQINIPLLDALRTTEFLQFRSFKAPLIGLPEVPHPFSRYKPTQEKKVRTDLVSRSRKRSSSQLESTSKYFKPSLINKEFLQLTDHLNELMQSCDPKMIVEHCNTLMASDVHNITVFPTEYVNKLQNYNHTPSLLRILSSFWTWNDSSVLRVLLGSDSEAIRLLDEFDAQTDLSQRLVSYPLPSPSPCMTPSDSSSTHTILAVKCARQYHQCLLKHVFEIREQMIHIFEITPHSLQLQATKSSSTILYWLIPKSVVPLIGTKVLEYGSVLNAARILEVSIFPGTRIITQAASLAGPLVYLSPITLPYDKAPVKLSTSALKKLMSLPEDLPEVMNDLLLEIEEKDTLLLQCHKEQQNLQAQIYEQSISTQENEYGTSLHQTIEYLKTDKVMLTEQLEDSDLKLQVQLNINESNKKLHEKITDVKLEKAQLNKEIERLNLELLASKKNIDNLFKDNEQLNSQVPEILKKEVQLSKEIERLNLELLASKDKIDNLNKDNEQLNSQLTEMLEKKNTKRWISKLLAIEEKKLISQQDSSNVEETDASTQSGLSREVVNEAFLGSTLPSPDVRVAMMGTEGSGKTCLGDTLTGQDFKDTSPTEGADEMEVVVKNTVDWSVLTKEEMIENLQQQVLQEAKHCAIEHRSQDSTVSATKATSGASSLQSNLSKSKPDAPSLPMLKLPGGDKMYILTIEEFKQLPSIIEKYDPLRRYLNIWDYAGQQVFQHTHGLFVSEEVVCLIVFDASKLLEEIPERRYKDDDRPARSGLETITYWMDLISCRVSKKSTSDSDLSEFLPTFILVGTKIDLLSSDIKEAEEIALQRFIPIFKEKFAGKPFAKHIAGSKNGQLFTPGSPSIFFLSNCKRNPEVVAKLQHVILEAAPKKSRPTRLVKMERKLMLLSHKEKMSVVNMEQVKEVAKSCGISQDDQEVLEVLKFFHQKGTLLYFNQVPALSNVIILCPQWLAKLLTYVLTNLICQPAGPPLAQYAEERNKKGLLRKELIDYCIDRFLAEESRKGHKVPKLMGNDVVDLLLNFKLMVDVTDASLGTKKIAISRIYLVPHLLPVQEFLPATGPCYKILYYFPGHFIPDILLDQLIVKCAEWNKRQKFGFLRLAYQWISMKLGGYQSYQLRPIHKINVVELTISSNPMMPQEEEITALANTNELIAVVKMFIDDLMQESMRATYEQYPVECYLPCPACSEVHVELEEVKQSGSDLCPTTSEFIDMMRYHKMLTQKKNSKARVSFSTLLGQEPQMKHLINIVVPRVAAHWNNVAYNLDFSIPTVKIISKKFPNDPVSCCEELLEQWLSSSEGTQPKTWSTLLMSLKHMDHLRAAVEEIEKELKALW